MGHQRRVAEGLMERFLLTESEAYDKARFVEAIEGYGDEASEVVYYLHGPKTDDEPELVDSIIRELREKCHDFANAIANLEAAFAGVKKRR